MADEAFADPALAALYERLHPSDERADFRFYLPLMMAARSVLDVGCGTGALLHRARLAGHAGRLTGLDPAAGMLAQARRRADVEWMLGDLGSGRVRGEFDLIVMSGHAFQVFVTDEELRTALAAVRDLLGADGRFAFETRNPAMRAWESWQTEAGGYDDEVLDASGAPVRTTYSVQAPTAGDLVSFVCSYSGPAWEEPRVSRSTLRFLGAGALSSFLAGAGLVIEEQYGDWDRSALTETSPEIITIARRDGTAPGLRRAGRL